MSHFSDLIHRALVGHRCETADLAAGHQQFRKQVHDNRNVRTASVKIARDFGKASDRALAVAQSAVRILEATREGQGDGADP